MRQDKQLFEVLLGFCAAVENGKLRTHDLCGNPLWSELRFKGYAAGYKSGYYKIIALFGPKNETDVITKFLINNGVSASAIESFETNVTTLGNAQMMLKYLADRDLKRSKVVGSTSHYHLPRAGLMGSLVHDLMIVWIAAEAWLFATTDPVEHEAIKQMLREELGSGPLVERIIDEIRGQGDLIAGRYQSHKL